MATLEEISKLFDISFSKTNEGFEDLRKEMKKMKEMVVDALKSTNQRIQSLECKLLEKNDEIQFLRKQFDIQKRRNNIMIFNVPETEASTQDLQSVVINLVKKALNIPFFEADLNDVYRIGQNYDKIRSVVVSLSRHIKLKTLLANKVSFRNHGVAISQDFPKSVSDERERLQPMVTALNQSGRKATLRNDDLFVDGKRWDKQTIEKEIENFNATKCSPSSHEEDNPNGVSPNVDLQSKRSETSKAAYISKPINRPIPSKTIPKNRERSRVAASAITLPVFQGRPTNLSPPIAGCSLNGKYADIFSK